MTIDITNPEHARALQSAVDLATEPAFAAVSTYCADMAKAADPPVKWAFEALSDPARAADLIRALVERAGLRVIGFRETSSFPFASIEVRALADGASCAGHVDVGIAIDVIHVPIAARQWSTMLHLRDVPATIARLLALSPGAGADAVLAALRGKP